MLRFITVLLLVFATASAQTDPVNALFTRIATNMRVRPLQGLSACGLAIDDLSDAAIRGGLNERALQRAITSQLTGLGIRLSDGPSVDGPFISTTVSVTRLGNAGYTFFILMELREVAQPQRDKEALFLSTTWRQFGTEAADKSGLRGKVMDTLSLIFTDFKQDYILANKQQ